MNFYELAIQGADKMDNVSAKSKLLTEIVPMLAEDGYIETALQTMQKIPDAYQCRLLLLNWNWKTLQSKHIPLLIQVLEADRQTATLAGRLAAVMVEVGKNTEAQQLLKGMKQPFASEKQRYDFFQASIRYKQENVFLQTILAGFTDETYRSWALFDLAKQYAEEKRWDEFEKIAEGFTDPLQKAWIYFQSDKYLEKSATILMSGRKSTPAESLSVQLRITGKRCAESHLKSAGEELLEQCENVITEITLPFERLKQQCFLAKVLRELKMLHSAADYILWKDFTQGQFTAVQRSQLYSYAAEAEPESIFVKTAFETAMQSERGTTDEERADCIAEMVKRIRSGVSGEDTEAQHYSPFAAPDCGC